MRFVTSCIEDVLTELGVAVPVTQVKASEPAPMTEVTVPGLSIRIRACLTAFPGVFDSGTEYLMFACWGRLSSMPSKFPTQKFRQQIGLSMNFRIIIDNGAADLTQLLVDFTLPEEL